MKKKTQNQKWWLGTHVKTSGSWDQTNVKTSETIDLAGRFHSQN